jgi:serine/threonine-protein kinase 19
MKKKLHSSALGVRWHARDLLGSGALQQLDTTSGPLLRIVKRH